jgi:pimeloyl-ACP methyl ester carboxylesterase
MEQSGRQLAEFVGRVLAATGTHKVDLVGHSEGTVMPRYWMEFLGGAPLIDRYVMMTPIWHGTNVAGAATIASFAHAFDPQATAAPLTLFADTTTCGSCDPAHSRSGGCQSAPTIPIPNSSNTSTARIPTPVTPLLTKSATVSAANSAMNTSVIVRTATRKR